MGCDIHMYTEKKDPKTGQWKYHGAGPYDDRNYRLFAILAGVRNNDDLHPIAYPRGLPGDESPEVRDHAEGWDGDGHSHSFFTLAELLDFPWNEMKGFIHGVVGEGTYQAWQKAKEEDPKAWPEMWCGWTSGRIITELEYKAMGPRDPVAPQMFDKLNISCKWQATYADMSGGFFPTDIQKLQEISGGDPESVRIVFWFDN